MSDSAASPHLSAGQAGLRFPTVTLIAPVLMGVVMALVFRSAYALMIAALGPVMALGSWWEARRTHRASQAEQHRREQLERERDNQRRARADEDYRLEQLGRFPAVSDWVTNPLWRPSTEQPLRIRVGLDSRAREDSPGSAEITLHAVPLTVEIGGGIAVVGQGAIAKNCFRAIALQCLALLATSEEAAGHIPSGWDLVNLPESVTWTASEALVLQLVAHADEVDSSVRSVVTASGQQAGVFVDGRRIDTQVRLDQISSPSALWAMRRLEQWTSQEKVAESRTPNFDDRSALWGRIDQSHWHDFVSDGPHGLVWGQSGRGKTLLLHSLLRDLAAHYPPERFSCVVIDFKGGSGVLAIDDLPHLAGVLTDLQPESIRRVQVGLRSEILRREHLLAAHRVSDISDLPDEVTCPRTLLVIDEVALLLDSDPGWAALLGDIASRGRSLGLHLLVSGQRITSQVPRSVVANAGIRWCLGVTDPAEALEYLPGVSQSAVQSLQQHPPGQVLGLVLGQAGYLARVEQRGRAGPCAGEGVAAPLWAPELPESIKGQGNFVAVVDDQPGQCLRPVTYDQLGSGLAVLVGEVTSGVDDVITRVAQCAPAVVWLDDQPARCFDHMGALAQQIEQGTPAPVCIVMPRLDRLLEGVPEPAQATLLSSISRLARAADESAGALVLVPCRPGVSALRRLVPSARSLIALSMHSLEHWLELDLPRDRWIPSAPAGRGFWAGQAVQFATPHPMPPASPQKSLLPERPSWRDVVGQEDNLVVIGDDLPDDIDQTLGSSVATMSIEQATLSRDRVEQAVGGGGVLLWGVGLGAARAIIGHERAPQLVAPDGTCWWVRPNRLRLVSIEPGDD